MKISQKQLADFKRIYQEQTGKEITDQAALELAQKLLGLVKLTYKPILLENLDKARERKGEIL